MPSSLDVRLRRLVSCSVATPLLPRLSPRSRAVVRPPERPARSWADAARRRRRKTHSAGRVVQRSAAKWPRGGHPSPRSRLPPVPALRRVRWLGERRAPCLVGQTWRARRRWRASRRFWRACRRSTARTRWRFAVGCCARCVWRPRGLRRGVPRLPHEKGMPELVAAPRLLRLRCLAASVGAAPPWVARPRRRAAGSAAAAAHQPLLTQPELGERFG